MYSNFYYQFLTNNKFKISIINTFVIIKTFSNKN